MPPGRRYDGSTGPAGRRPIQPRPPEPAKAPKPAKSSGGGGGSPPAKGGCLDMVLAVALLIATVLLALH